MQPTPHLDALRPLLLRALHVRGWTRDFGQHGPVFTVRASKGAFTTVLRFRECDEGVTYEREGSGAAQALRDLAAEGLEVRS